MGIASEFKAMRSVIRDFSPQERRDYRPYRNHIYIMFNEKNKGGKLQNSGFSIGKDTGFGLLTTRPPEIKQNTKDIFFGGLFDLCKESRMAIRKQVVTALRARRRLVERKHIDIDHRSKTKIEIGIDTALSLQYKNMLRVRDLIGDNKRFSDADKPFLDGDLTIEWRKRAVGLLVKNIVQELHSGLESPIVDIERELLFIRIERFVYEKSWI
jgi:hypothetical protein